MSQWTSQRPRWLRMACRVWWALPVASGLWLAPLPAQKATPKPAAATLVEEAAPPLTVALAEEKKQAWEASALEPAVKEQVLALAADAVGQLRQRDQAQAEAKAFRARAAALPEEAAKLKQLPAPVAPPPVDPKATLESLEVALAASHEAVEKARQALAAAQELPRTEATRRPQLTAIIADLGARLEVLRQPAPPAGNEPAELTEARALARTASLQAAQARLEAAQAELAYYDTALAVAWPSLAQEAAAAALRQAQETEALWQERVKQARVRAAEASAEAAREHAGSAEAPVRPELARVAQHAEINRVLVSQRIPEAEAQLKEVNGETNYWRDIATRTKEKIRRLGASGIIGVELRRQLQQLPSPAALRARVRSVREAMLAVERARLELEEELAGLPAAGGREAEGAEAKAEEAMRGILTEQLKNYGVYFNLLVRVAEATQELVTAVEAHRRFIREQILWMPSAEPASTASWGQIADSLTWLAREVTGSLLPEWGRSLRHGSFLGLALMPLGLAIGLFALQRRARRSLALQAELAQAPEPRFLPTLCALGWTLLLALPWPLLLWALALTLPDETSMLAAAAAMGVKRAAVLLFGWEVFRQLLRARGLAEAHFGWPPETVKPLRRQLWPVMLVGGAAVALGSTLRYFEAVRHDVLERTCLLLVLGVVAWWLHRLWKRGRVGAWKPASDPPTRRPAARFGWWLGHMLCVFVPIVLGVLALRGYLHTAQELSVKLGQSLGALAGFLLLRELFFRWYGLHRQSLRSARARVLREAREASRAAAAKVDAASATSSAEDSGTKAAVSDVAPEIAPPGLRGPDIDVIGQEMRQLVEIVMVVVMTATLWFVWVDVLPAAQKLGRQPIGELFAFEGNGIGPAATADVLPGGKSGSSGEAMPSASSGLSVAGVMLAALAGIFTWMAARRIPGALQFLLSSQVKLDSGLRFAVGTVTRYLIVITGFVIVLRLLGVAWSHVQWLAAALTVGLGFGLQEIFANFFSGLILLFERPIRLGDVVTIDSITGTVTRIHIRATTIRTADYTEYIVPNREFITGKLLNWTLSDTTSRLTLEVNVAYGTDLPRALDLLRRLVAAHPLVRKDPSPSVSCESLRDNSILLVVRFYLSSLDQRLAAQTDLLCQIVKEFAAAGIELAQPLRPLYVGNPPASAETAAEKPSAG